jgi:shikimate kinase
MQPIFVPLPEPIQQLAETLSTVPTLSRIVLTGFMGCGKSTLGRKLAHALGFQFLDTDAVIEHQRRMKIPDIFALEGEKAFRAYERDVLQDCMTLEHYVIATGGGALINQENLDLVLDEALVIYLEVDENDLLERILFSPKDRPLMDVSDPKVVFDTMLDARRPFYEQAHVHVNTRNLKPQDALIAIIEALDIYVHKFLPSLK